MRNAASLARRVALSLVGCGLLACGGNGNTNIYPGANANGTSSSSSTAAVGGAGASSSSAVGGSTGTGTGTGTGASSSSTSGSGVGQDDATTGTEDATAGNGSGDASVGGGTGGEGGTESCPATAVFCDGFEGSTTLSANWTKDPATPTAPNVIEVVSTMAHTGTNSAHIHFGTASGGNFIDEKLGFPITTASYGRVWLYVMNTPESGHQVYIEASSGVSTQNNGVRPLNTDTCGSYSNGIKTNADPPDNGNCSSPAVALPQATWTCFEWEISVTGTMASLSLYMNGTQVVPTYTYSDTGYPISGLVEQRIGYERYGTGSAGDIYMDDYAIGTTARIGCGSATSED